MPVPHFRIVRRPPIFDRGREWSRHAVRVRSYRSHLTDPDVRFCRCDADCQSQFDFGAGYPQRFSIHEDRVV